jgi:multidrug efflux pump subunit AcrA (membrane-fusion protein)
LQIQVTQERATVGSLLKKWKDAQAGLTLDSNLPSALDKAIADLKVVRTYFDDMTTLYASFATPNGASGESTIASNKSTASSARANIDSSVNDLIAVGQSYQTALTNVEDTKASIAFKVAPPEVDDVTVSKSQLTNAEASLATAQEAYASRIITAPFDGQIGGLTAQVGSQISSSDSLGKLITPEKVVNVSLNEVDAAKIKANDMVNVTFDAVPDVTIKGHINYVDPLGTVSQGVVSYSVQIKLDEQNDQVKTGMTAAATIVTSEKENVLLVPASAITTIGGKKYVLVSDSAPAIASSTGMRPVRTGSQVSSAEVTTRRVEVTVGLTNNIFTEILSGLTEGQVIVVRSIVGSTATTGTKTPASAATTRTTGAAGMGTGGATRTFTTGAAR